MAEATSKLNLLVQLKDEASNGMRNISSSIEDLGSSMNFASAWSGALAGGLAALAGGAILNGLRAYADAEVSMAKFGAILSTLPPNLQSAREKILAAADAAILLGFDNETAALSMAKLLQATGDASFMFRAFQAAMDLSRLKGMDLESATQALVLAFQGNARLLKQLGIDVDEHASKETILAAVMAKVKGQADAYATTLTGLWEITKQIGDEVMEAFGTPFAEAAKDALTAVLGWVKGMGGINAALKDFGSLLGLVTAIVTGVFITGIIAATAAVLAMMGAFGLLLAAFAAGAVLIGGIVAFIRAEWVNLNKDLTAVFNAIGAAFNRVFFGIDAFFSNMVSRIKSDIREVLDLANRIGSMLSSPMNAVGEGLGKTLGKILGFTPMASGGIVTGPTPILAGEAGPEAIIPLSRLGGMGGGGVTVVLQGDFYTDREVAEKWANQIATLIGYQLRSI